MATHSIYVFHLFVLFGIRKLGYIDTQLYVVLKCSAVQISETAKIHGIQKLLASDIMSDNR